MPVESRRRFLPRLERRSEQLDNGLGVEFVSLPHLQSAAISFLVRSGSRYESTGSNGISHLLEHMLFRGTKSHPSAYELSLSIEKLAGTLNACTHVDFTQFDLTLPPENVLEGIARLAEILSSPIFDSFDTEKKIIMEELLEDLDDSGMQIDPDNVVRHLLFAEHSLGFPIAGTIDNIKRFASKSVGEHLQRYYTAGNSTLCVSGAIDFNEVSREVHRQFSGLRRGPRKACEPPDLGDGLDRFAYVHHADSQTHVRLSFPLFGLRDPRVMPLRLLERILDDGLSARLHHAICDRRGLAYDAFAAADLYEDCGVFDLGASVRHEKVPELLAALLEVIADLQATAIGEDELSKARARYLWDLRTLVDDPEGVNTFFGTNALFGLSHTPEKLLREAESVDANALLRVSQSIFDRTSVRLACVGVMSDALITEARNTLGI